MSDMVSLWCCRVSAGGEFLTRPVKDSCWLTTLELPTVGPDGRPVTIEWTARAWAGAEGRDAGGCRHPANPPDADRGYHAGAGSSTVAENPWIGAWQTIDTGWQRTNLISFVAVAAAAPAA
jgi:hypothetical protein